jgi:Ser/Thr protein kinase RdoA (MazF antagonist)
MTRRDELRRLRVVAAEALALYGLADASLSLLNLDQFFNTSFGVAAPDGKRYVLRVHRPSADPTRKRVEIESELWWLRRIRADLHLDVPGPVQALDGAEVVSMAHPGAESRYCVLFRFIEGRFLKRGLRPRHLEQVGMLTARLHRYSETLTVPGWFTRPIIDRTDGAYEDSAAGLFAEQWSAEAAETIRSTVRSVRAIGERLGNGPGAFGLIHTDIHQTNFLFRGGEIRLIDFDDCGWGHYLYDLAVTAQQVAHLPRREDLWDALLSGYRRVRPLSPEHEAMIEPFRMLRELQDITLFLRNRNLPAEARFLPSIAPVLEQLRHFLASAG